MTVKMEKQAKGMVEGSSRVEAVGTVVEGTAAVVDIGTMVVDIGTTVVDTGRRTVADTETSMAAGHVSI